MCQRAYPLSKPELLWLDLDSTLLATYGEQGGESMALVHIGLGSVNNSRIKRLQQMLEVNYFTHTILFLTALLSSAMFRFYRSTMPMFGVTSVPASYRIHFSNYSSKLTLHLKTHFPVYMRDIDSDERLHSLPYKIESLLVIGKFSLDHAMVI